MTRMWKTLARWKTFTLVGVVLGVVAGASRAPLLAHHSFAVVYLEQDTIEIEGEVVEFQYRNPHAWIFVQGMESPGGQTKIYAAEWVSVSQLERASIPKNFFKAGDTLRIWASPNKNPNDNRVRLKRMERKSDGWRWAGGRGETR
jgi:hypothetical protein